MDSRRAPRLVSRTYAALFALIVAASAVPLVVPFFRFEGGVQEGDVASRTFSAVHDAPPFESEALTEAARADAAAGVAEVPLAVDTTVRDQQVARADRYLDQVRAIVARTDSTSQQKQEAIAGLTTPQPLSNFERTALQSFDVAQLESLSQKVAVGLTTLMDSAIREEDILPRVEAYVGPVPATTEPENVALKGLLKVFTVETFRLDEAATEAERQRRRAEIQPVTRSFAEGQVIVTEGQEITAQDIEALKATGVIDDGLDLFGVAGGALIAAGFGLVLGLYAYLFQPFREPANRRMAVIAVTIAVLLLGVRIVMPIVTPDSAGHYYAFALPVAAVAMVTACFADLSFAALVAGVTGLFAAFIGGTAPQIAGAGYVGSLQSIEIGMTYAAGGLAGAAAVHNASRLGRFALAAVAVSFTTGGVMAVFWLVAAQRADIDLAWIAVAAGVHGVGAAVLSVGVFVVGAMAFGVTTRLQLMELSQAEHPLLRRLQEEAPGTYHHSMLVGALAERAATRVDADSLLVRVGAYYHDIGKLAMPAHYVENMLDGNPSPHDSLEPAQSAKVIRAHVANGLDLAKKYHLPGPVREFIPQHHGTRLVTYFYRQAVAAGEQVAAADYRYEGPRPQTRETAIVMLADSCEAVARSRQEEGAPNIDQVVDAVFAERLAEGQLDECDVTLKDLQLIAASFKATLRAVYHPRVRYPSPTPEEIATLARGETPLPSR